LARFSKELKKEIKARWPAWFGARWSEVCDSELGWSAYRFAAEFASIAPAERKMGFPSSRVGAWKKGKRLPSPATAFYVGEVLRVLPIGMGSPLQLSWVSGPVALHAAGYVADCIGVLGRMVALGGGDRVEDLILALPVLSELPLLSTTQLRQLNAEPRVTFPSVRGKPSRTVLFSADRMIRGARENAAIAAQDGGAFFRHAWEEWSSNRSCDSHPKEFQDAHELANSDLFSRERRLRYSWDWLDNWARTQSSKKPERLTDYDLKLNQLDQAWDALVRVRAASPPLSDRPPSKERNLRK